MAKVTLKFTDPNGGERTVTAQTFPYVIGRHSENDLCIPDPRLSRQHLRLVERSGAVWAEDLGSSNGTELNSRPLYEAAQVRNGDRLDLGGFLISVSDDADFTEKPSGIASPTAEPQYSAPKRTSEPKEATSNGIPVWLIFMAPVAALLLVLVAGGAVYFFTQPTTGQNTVAENNGPSSTSDDPNATPEPTEKPAGPVTDPGSSDSPESTPDANSGPTPPPADLTGTAKVEQYGTAFLRKIAHNEPRAFLTSEQAKIVEDRIKQISGSSGLATNIESARKNGAGIRSIATEKNIKPLFLATAAINQLGTGRGDVLATSKSMAEVFDKLAIQIGNEFSDDCLLMIAGYDQGEAGAMKMRNMLQDLATKFPQVNNRAIRTIWFLQKQGKITPAEYSSAVNFLAIGVITQNPKEFGVNTEALDL